MGNRKQKVLCTGYKGFIGSNLYKELKKQGHDVKGIDLKDGVDIRTCEFKGKYDIIYHVAAQASIPYSFENPFESHEHNVLGTLRILEFARKIKAKVVFSSSSSIYGDPEIIPTPEWAMPMPVAPYALQKLECEEYMKFYWDLGVKSVALRYFNVFGEGQEHANGGYSLVLSRFLEQYKSGKPFTIVGTGIQKRDFVYVGDVVRANIQAAEWLNNSKDFEAFNIGSGRNHSVQEIAKMIDPKHLKTYLQPRVEPMVGLADIYKARIFLKWQPLTSIQEWIKNNLKSM